MQLIISASITPIGSEPEEEIVTVVSYRCIVRHIHAEFLTGSRKGVLPTL